MDAYSITPTDMTLHSNKLLHGGQPVQQSMWRLATAVSSKASRGGVILAQDLDKGEGRKRFYLVGLSNFFAMYSLAIKRFQTAMEMVRNGLMTDQIRTDYQRCCYYEIIGQGDPDDPNRGDRRSDHVNPCNLMLDIEVYRATNPDFQYESVRHKMLRCMSELLHNMYGIQDAHERWTVVEMDSSRPHKLSRHIVIHLPDGFMFTNWFHVGAFMRRLILVFMRSYGHPMTNELFIYGKTGDAPRTPIFDTDIYTMLRNMRIVWSSKWDEGRPLELLTAERDGTWTRVPPAHMTEAMFLSTFVQYPRQPDLRNVRLLSCSEPNNLPPTSTKYIPGLVESSYLLPVSAIQPDGSVVGFDIGHKTESRGISNDLNDCVSRVRKSSACKTVITDDVLRQYVQWITENITDVNVRTPKFEEEDGVMKLKFRSYQTYCPIAGKKHEKNNQYYELRVAQCDTRTCEWQVVENVFIHVSCPDRECLEIFKAAKREDRAAFTQRLTESEVSRAAKLALQHSMELKTDSERIATKTLFRALL